MRKIIKEGVKTRVLMLSATPVNNRLTDLRNQIAFATEGDDTALPTTASTASSRPRARPRSSSTAGWPGRGRAHAQPPGRDAGLRLLHLLDHLTIARSRRHIEKYYGTTRPAASRTAAAHQHQGRRGPGGPVPRHQGHQPEIRRLNLAAYAPLRYVLPHKQAAYDAKYSTEIRGGESFFRQADREESLIHLLRVNVLKRMESAVSSFALTVQRQLRDVEAVLAQIERMPTTLNGDRRARHRRCGHRRPRLRSACWSAARSRCCWATWT
jgi:hypothetical protein